MRTLGPVAITWASRAWPCARFPGQTFRADEGVENDRADNGNGDEADQTAHRVRRRRGTRTAISLLPHL